MKIVVINGQNHKGSTYHIGNELVKKLNGEVTEFFLPKDFGEFCVGCTKCFIESEWLLQPQDGMKSVKKRRQPLTEKLQNWPRRLQRELGKLNLALQRECIS